MQRRHVTMEILEAKRRKGLTFTQIAEQVGADRVWLTAALHGQHPLSADQAEAVSALLELPEGAAAVLREIPRAAHSRRCRQPIRPSTGSTRSCRSTDRR